MSDTMLLLRKEIERAKARHPQQMDMTRFIGAASMKLGAIQAKTLHHSFKQNPLEYHMSKLAALQLAAVCLRFIDDHGGVDTAKYEAHCKIPMIKEPTHA